MLCIVEELTPAVFSRNILPRLKQFQKKFSGETITLYYIDASPAAVRLTEPLCARFDVPVKRLDFCMADIFADDGDLARLKIAYVDLARVLERIKVSAEFKSMLHQADIAEVRAGFYLAKQGMIYRYDGTILIWKLIYLVYLARWTLMKSAQPKQRVILFAKRRLWMEEVLEHVRSLGVEVETQSTSRGWKRSFIELVGEDRLKAIYYLYCCYGARSFFMRGACLKEADRRADDFIVPSGDQATRLMVEYNGFLNVDKPHLYSDLFFDQSPRMRHDDILVAFNYPADPFDQSKADAVRGFGASAVALNPAASLLSPRGVFHYDSLRHPALGRLARLGRSEETRWLKSQLEKYRMQAGYWQALFERFRVRAYLSWYKYDARHAIIADVLRGMNGVTALYQRAFESEPSAETAVDVDVFFGFSQESAKIERASGSRVPYYILTGYSGDHRFPLVVKQSQAIREQLMANGAQKIVAFFDENSADDARWHTGNEFMQVNYDFLLRRALEDKTLGLVFKPKVPGSLRRRLGPVAELLTQVEAQGRCFILEAGKTHGSHPPVVAAKAADIAIHGHLSASTAGIEAALAGAPTVILDREGWPSCPLYENGAEGKIIFRSWEALWPILSEHLKQPGGTPGFADWSLLLPVMDPFRDGKGAQRVGDFLGWVMDGLRVGRRRDQVLDDAAQRYAKMWGKDKVISINR